MISKINKILDYVEEKDPKLYKHLEETGMYAYAVAKSINLSAKDRNHAHCAGLMHDIGKLEGPFEILKVIENSLSEDEKSDIQKHVFYGSKLVSTIEGLEYLHDSIKHHHEHWDGTGYPDNLKGESIPIIARVVFIACSYHVMRLENNMTHEEAIREIRKNSGVKFDPSMVEPFIEIIEKEELF